MARRIIVCSECGKTLFETEKSDGAAMSETQRLGFVAKMPFLYGISGCFFFCNKDCHKEWSRKHIQSEAKEKGDKAIAELKSKQPKMVEDTVKAMQRFAKELRQIRNVKYKLK